MHGFIFYKALAIFIELLFDRCMVNSLHDIGSFEKDPEIIKDFLDVHCRQVSPHLPAHRIRVKTFTQPT